MTATTTMTVRSIIVFSRMGFGVTIEWQSFCMLLCSCFLLQIQGHYSGSPRRPESYHFYRDLSSSRLPSSTDIDTTP